MRKALRNRRRALAQEANDVGGKPKIGTNNSTAKLVRAMRTTSFGHDSSIPELSGNDYL